MIAVAVAAIIAFGLWTLLVVLVTRRRGSKITPPTRLILPMSSGTKILPRTSAQISAQPQNFAFRIDGLIIEDAEDWIVNELVIDEQSQFVQSGDVPGGMFSAEAQGCGIRLGVAPVGSNVQIIVTYIGEEPREFSCMALGTPIHDAQPVEPLRLILPMSGYINVLPGKSIQITARPQEHIFQPERLVIHGGQDWRINDAKVGNRSQFMQSGDVPGSAFEACVDATFCMDDVAPGGDFALVVTYIGDSADGAPFSAGVVGRATKARRVNLAKRNNSQAVRFVPNDPNAAPKLRAMP
jgi:hypothetical protein